MLRPQLKLPIWVAIAVVLGTFILRGFMRGGDFSVDATDLLVIGLLAISLLTIGLVRAWAAQNGPDEFANEDDREYRSSGKDR